MPSSLNALSGNPNLRILIVDDNPSIHADFRKILCPNESAHKELMSDAATIFGVELAASSEQKFELDSAYQGAEALEMVAAAAKEGRPYSVAFVDIRMPPGWNGVETISRIWKAHPDLQVVICTAYSDHCWEEIIAEVGRTESLLILKKPFDQVEVLQLAHALTAKWSLDHALRSRLSDLESLVEARTKELQQTNSQLRAEAAVREDAQRALLRSEECFSKAFRANPLPVTIHAVSDGAYVDANDSFLRMAGYVREELLAQTAAGLEVILEPTSAEHPANQPARNLPGTIRTRSGDTRDILVSTELLTIAGQACVLTLFVDITEQRVLERKLRSAQKLEALGQMAAGIAHNFNNILGVILGHASLQLETEGTAEGRKRSLGEIATAAERGAALVRQLLAAAQQQRTSDAPLDLNTVVARTRDLMRPILGENFGLFAETAEALPLIRADLSSVDQILMNLVLNARDAMPRSGRIVIRTALAEVETQHAMQTPGAKAGRFVLLSVTDTGCGMDANTLERVFEPFFTTKGVGKGTGLGLATVHGLVAKHGGWIEVASEPGAGTTFSLYFPICHESLVEVPTETIGTSLAKTGETVLLVEDELCLQKIVTMALESNGYRVLVADDARHALRLWSEHQESVNILLTDVTMPGGLSGFDLAEKLLSTRPALPVIFSSGYAPEGLSDFDRYSSATFLPKPCTAAHILQAVRSRLDAA